MYNHQQTDPLCRLSKLCHKDSTRLQTGSFRRRIYSNLHWCLELLVYGKSMRIDAVHSDMGEPCMRCTGKIRRQRWLRGQNFQQCKWCNL
jgi:hypothetical protein